MGGNSRRKLEPVESAVRPGKRQTVRKSRPASQDDYWVQPADRVVLVDVGPTGKGLEDARARIRAGEDRDQVIDELVGQVLEARVDMNKRRLKDVTERLEDLPRKTRLIHACGYLGLNIDVSVNDLVAKHLACNSVAIPDGVLSYLTGRS